MKIQDKEIEELLKKIMIKYGSLITAKHIFTFEKELAKRNLPLILRGGRNLERFYPFSDLNLRVKRSSFKGLKFAEVFYRHQARYFIGSLIYKGRVLELGAGSFFGHQIISQSPWVNQVISVERDPISCFFGFKHFYHPQKSLIYCADVLEFPMRENYYDCLVLIELFEHLNKANQDFLIKKSFQALKKGGCYLATSPLAPAKGRIIKVGGWQNPQNPYHLWEPTKQAFLIRHQKIFGKENVEFWTFPPHRLSYGQKQELAIIICQKISS